MSRRILIVDLEEDLLSSLKELMEAQGYQVTSLSDLRKIFDICAESSFDIVLSHLIDPHLKVDAVFDQLKSQNPSTKYIIMTGAIEVHDQIRMRYPVIFKPFQIDEFERLVKSI